MKKNIIAKIILLIIAFSLVVCMYSKAYAADDDVPDLGNTITGGDTETDEDEEEPVEETPSETTKPSETQKPSGNTETTTTEKKEETTSKYPDKDIPYAGPAETIIMGTLFVACGVVGVYTFMKLSEYSNV